MPFYIRKSVSAGPFRFNFSKGGVGASVGVKGLRFGAGPRGHYVHAGLGGVYYRSTLGSSRKKIQQPTYSPRIESRQTERYSVPGVDMVEVESGDVCEMRDDTLNGVLDDINAKSKQIDMTKLLAILITLVAGYVLFSRTTFFAALIGSLVAGLIGYQIGRWLNSFRRSSVLFYELTEEAQAAYEAAVEAFDSLNSCQGKWHVAAGGAVNDLTTWKRNSGASHVVSKKATTLTYALPDVIKCNLTPPAVDVGRQRLFFLPDMVLVKDGNQYGAVLYNKLHIRHQHSNFIEEGSVPSDATIVGQTWKHPNKSGGPDRRFKSSYQIPVCKYEVMHLASDTGLNELLEFSKLGLCKPFADSLKRLPSVKESGSVNHPRLTSA